MSCHWTDSRGDPCLFLDWQGCAATKRTWSPPWETGDVGKTRGADTKGPFRNQTSQDVAAEGAPQRVTRPHVAKLQGRAGETEKGARKHRERNQASRRRWRRGKKKRQSTAGRERNSSDGRGGVHLPNRLYAIMPVYRLRMAGDACAGAAWRDTTGPSGLMGWADVAPRVLRAETTMPRRRNVVCVCVWVALGRRQKRALASYRGG